MTHQANPARGFCTQTNTFLGPELLPALPGEQGRVARLLRKRFVCCKPALGTDCLLSSPEPLGLERQAQNRAASLFSSSGFQSAENMDLWRGGRGENWMLHPTPRSAPPEK